MLIAYYLLFGIYKINCTLSSLKTPIPDMGMRFKIINYNKYLAISFILFSFISCKLYESPTSLNEASFSDEKGVLKVTLKDGEELMYDRIISDNNRYYGIKREKGREVRDELDVLNVENVQRINKRSSSFVNVLGVAVGLGSLYFLYAMFGG